MVLPSLADETAFASLAYLDLRQNGVDGKSVVRVVSSIPSLQGRLDGATSFLGLFDNARIHPTQL